MAMTAQQAEQQMSEADRAALRAAGERYNNATTDAERQAAHDEAERIRGGYGYSGGIDGSGYIAQPNPPIETPPQPKQPATVAQSGTNNQANPRGGRTRTTVTHADGTTSEAYIVDGHTVDANGNAYQFQNGDIVNTNGGQYQWNNGTATPYTAPAQTQTPTANPTGTNQNNGGLTPTVVYRNGRYINALINENGETVSIEGGRFQFQDGDVVRTNGGNYIWQNGRAVPYEGDMPGYTGSGGSHSFEGGPTDYLQWMWNNSPTADQVIGRFDQEYRDVEQYIREANQAATDQAIADLRAQLENGLTDYDVQRAQAAITQAKAASDAALRNIMAGDMGGIGQKQYSAEMNAYDQQMLSIQLEQINFQNSINQQITQLEAEGRYNEAKLLAEWGQARIEALQQEYNWVYQMQYQNAYDLDYLNRTKEQDAWNREQADLDRAWQQGMQRLQLGIFTAEDAMALGIPEEDAQRIADYYTQMAAIDLEAAQADLAARYGRSSGGGGGGRYYSGDGGGGGDDSSQVTDGSWSPKLNNDFAKMYAAGIDPDSPLVYTYLREAGYAQGDINNEDYGYALQYADYVNAQKEAELRAPIDRAELIKYLDNWERAGERQRMLDRNYGGRIYVQGMGYMTPAEIKRAINANQIIAGYNDDGSIYYVYRSTGTPATGGGNPVIEAH